MAEVMLLVIFAVLLSLSALLLSERQRRTVLEERLSRNGETLILSTGEARFLEQLRLRKGNIDLKSATAILRLLDTPLASVSPTDAEAKFIMEIRNRNAEMDQKSIDDFWTELIAGTAQPKTLLQNLAIAQTLAKIKGLPTEPKEFRDLLQGALELKARGEHDWPPIINLSEAGGYFFRTGSAELSENFGRKLIEIVIPELVNLAQTYRVDVIEVIGHTDEQAIAQRASNFDLKLLGVAKGSEPISVLIPADNAGLGLARAVAVVRTLMGDNRMKDYKILPLSGGQLIDVDERITKGGTGNVKERRRIEIRVRRSQQPGIGSQ